MRSERSQVLLIVLAISLVVGGIMTMAVLGVSPTLPKAVLDVVMQLAEILPSGLLRVTDAPLDVPEALQVSPVQIPPAIVSRGQEKIVGSIYPVGKDNPFVPALDVEAAIPDDHGESLDGDVEPPEDAQGERI